MANIIKRCVTAIGLDPVRYSAKTLRYSRGRPVLQLANNDYQIPRLLLGHTDIRSTIHYCGVDHAQALEISKAVQFFDPIDLTKPSRFDKILLKEIMIGKQMIYLIKSQKKILNRDNYFFFYQKMNKISQIGTGLAAMLAATNANAQEANSTTEAQAVDVATITQADCLKLETTDKMIACLEKLNEAKRKQAAAEIAAAEKRLAAKRAEIAALDKRLAENAAEIAAKRAEENRKLETIKRIRAEREEVEAANRGLRRVIAIQEAQKTEQETEQE